MDNTNADRNIRRILLMRWSAMGDIALASTGFESVRRAYPEAQIDLDVLPPWPVLFRDDPRFNAILGFPLRARGRLKQLVASVRWLLAVRRARYDLIVDLQSTDRSRIMIAALWLLGAQVRNRVGNRPCFPYNRAPRAVAEPVHALTRINRALAAASIPAAADRPHLYLSDAERRAAHDILTALDMASGDYVVFLPGSQSAGYLKRWGARRYARLAELLVANGLKGVLILGGADEQRECELITEHSRARVHNLCGKTSLQQVLALCEGAKFIVGNDTGTAHVAAAADRPLLVLCGPTDPRKVLPAGSKVRSLQAEIPCINCYRKHCSHHSCMAAMTPQRVLQVVQNNPPFVDERSR